MVSLCVRPNTIKSGVASAAARKAQKEISQKIYEIPQEEQNDLDRDEDL
jgi:hypothetical protein